MKIIEPRVEVGERGLAAMKNRICVICGKEFTPRNSKQVCCSARCSCELQRSWYTKKPQIKKVCVVCGKEFTTPRETQICCSTECSYQHSKQLTREKQRRPEVKKICRFCGKEFTTGDSKRAFCSLECRMDSRFASQRKKRAENKKPTPPQIKKADEIQLTPAQIEQRERLKQILLNRRANRGWLLECQSIEE